jgi:hypothetical protein
MPHIRIGNTSGNIQTADAGRWQWEDAKPLAISYEQAGKSKEMARRAENARRRDMEESYYGLKERAAPRLFSVAADEWLAVKKPTIAERNHAIEEAT